MATTPFRVIRTDTREHQLDGVVRDLKRMENSINDYLLDDDSAPPWTLSMWQERLAEIRRRLERLAS